MSKRYINYIGLLGIISLFLALFFWLIYRTLDFSIIISLIVGFMGSIVYLACNVRKLGDYLGLKATKFKASIVISTLLVVTIIVILNYLAAKNNKRIDLTENQIFSLSDQTIQILTNLEKEVEFYNFYKGKPSRLISDLLVEYQYYSNKLKVQYYDLDKKPGLAKKFNVKSYGNTIIQCGNRWEQISGQSEQDLTDAILKVISGAQKKIYFVTGHGEREIDKEELPEGYFKAKWDLEAENYSVTNIELLRKEAVPGDCDVLIIAGPKNNYFPHEIEMVKSYLTGGGNLFLMLDPKPFASLNELIKYLRIKVNDDIIIDMNPIGQLFGSGPTVPVVSSYEDHIITNKLQAKITFFPMSRSFTIKENEIENVNEKITIKPLIKSSKTSWGEKNLQDKIKFDEGEDMRGPLVIGLLQERTNKLDKGKSFSEANGINKHNAGKVARIIIMGDSDFAVNQFFHTQENANLFLNCVNWLSGTEELISIRPKTNQDRRLTLTVEQSNVIFYLVIVVYPLMIILIGIVVWIKRRRH